MRLAELTTTEVTEASAPDRWGREIAGAPVGFDTLDFSDSGATGKPTQASADAGRQLVTAAVESLDELVDWLVDQPLDELWSKPHK